MAKPNAFVKISGNLLENEEVLSWFKLLVNKYSVAICIGGGEQINDEFKKRGFEIKFGIMGRITKTLEERQVARDVLEVNQAFVQDMLDDKGINARVIIPAEDVSSVLCHKNGDIKILEATGYDKIFLLTLKNKVKEKEEFVRLLEIALQFLMKTNEKLNKIKVIGF